MKLLDYFSHFEKREDEDTTSEKPQDIKISGGTEMLVYTDLYQLPKKWNWEEFCKKMQEEGTGQAFRFRIEQALTEGFILTDEHNQRYMIY